MAVITIAVCDEIRKDAQKLYRQLSTLLPDAEILIYRSRQSLLDGLTEGHKICNVVFMGWMVKMERAWRQSVRYGFGEIIFRSSW